MAGRMSFFGQRSGGARRAALAAIVGAQVFFSTPAGAAETLAPPPDVVTLKDGTAHEGTLVDLTDRSVVLRVGEARKSFPRADVAGIRRSAPEDALAFFEKKFEEFRKSPSAKSWRSLAKFAMKRALLPEGRRALRELLLLEPWDEEARKELGQVLFEGRWLDEDEVAAKLAEGYVLSEGKLTKEERKVEVPAKAKEEPKDKVAITEVKKPEPEPSTYKILRREPMTKAKRDQMDREREKRLKAARSYLKQKEKEYEGVPWDKRHEIKTEHFHIICNSTLRVTQAYGELMELIRAKLAEMFPTRVRRNVRAPVFIYASQEDFINAEGFGRFGGRGLGGYYIPSSQQIHTYHGTFGFTGTTFSVLCHEGTHYYQGLVLQKFDNVPIWLIEGLAVYFGDGSFFDPEKKKITVGLIPRDRLAHIQEKIATNRNTPIAKLVAMDRYSGFSGSEYADAWALIYFLVNSGPKGQKLLQDYWGIGLERELDKRDFKALAEKHFGSMDELEKQYVEYISKLDMPSAGKVVGDYFVSDTFQFDYKIPAEDWEFFEDKADRKLLIGMLKPGRSAEIRVYYENNIENEKSADFFKKYAAYAGARYKDFRSEPVKISNLDGYRATYLDENSEKVDVGELSDLIRFFEQARTFDDKAQKAGRKKGPRKVVKYLLIQIDGIVTIDCSAKPEEFDAFADVFAKAHDNFTLTFTRRW